MNAADHTAIFPASASPDAQAAGPADAMGPYFTFGRTICALRQHVGRPRGRDAIDAYECKWDSAAFVAEALTIFREHHPRGKNYMLAPLTGPTYARQVQGLEVTVCGLDTLT